MKKLGLIMVLLIGISLFFFEEPLGSGEADVRFVQESQGTIHRPQSITVKKNDIYKGNLILVNDRYAVQEEGMKEDIIPLAESPHDFGLVSQDIALSKEITEKFAEMVSVAEHDGVDGFVISSGFRDEQEQAAIFNEIGSEYALPAGHSEHQLGLSLDVGSVFGKMSEAQEGEWIRENAWKYGFILRYPENKTAITNIQYEPWHIRYVGLPHSAIMQKKDWVLEEYISYLQSEKKLAITVNGMEYQVTFVKVSDSVEIPVSSKYELSGNNIDGVILTEISN